MRVQCLSIRAAVSRKKPDVEQSPKFPRLPVGPIPWSWAYGLRWFECQGFSGLKVNV